MESGRQSIEDGRSCAPVAHDVPARAESKGTRGEATRKEESASRQPNSHAVAIKAFGFTATESILIW